MRGTPVRDSLDKSILRVILAYLALQIAIFSAFAAGGGFFARHAVLFAVVCVLFHAFLYFMLGAFKADFALAETGEPLTRVNLANRITLFRVSSLPTLLFLVIASRDFHIRAPLLVFMALVFISDFLDGWVSRARGQVTRVGKLMDSASDYLVLVVLTVVFFDFGFIRVWFFGLVIGRLALQAIFMATIFVARGSIKPRTTILGKAAVASVMVLYSGLLLELLALPFGFKRIVDGVEIAVAVVIVASIVDKVIAFAKDLTDPAP